MDKRSNKIDIARGIAIVLVVFGHLLSDNNVLKSMIYCFHMPLFFILSGMVFKNESICFSIEKRLKSIYIPYLIWSFIFSSLNIRNLMLVLYGTNETLIKAGSNGMLWFLSTLFFSGAIVSIVLKLCKSNTYISLSVILLLFFSSILKRYHNVLSLGLPLSLDIVFLAAAYMLIGNVYSKVQCDYDKIIKNDIIKISVGVSLILLSVVAIGFDTVKDYPQMATLDVGNIPIYFISSILPSFGVVYVSKVIEKIKVVSNILIWLGKNTMSIFIFHRTILYMCKDIIYKHSIHFLIPVFIIMMFYCCIAAVIINRCCPWLVGKAKK